MAQNAKSRARELAHTTAQSAGVAVRDGKAKAADLSNKTQEAAGDFTSRTQQYARLHCCLPPFVAKLDLTHVPYAFLHSPEESDHSCKE